MGLVRRLNTGPRTGKQFLKVEWRGLGIEPTKVYIIAEGIVILVIKTGLKARLEPNWTTSINRNPLDTPAN